MAFPSTLSSFTRPAASDRLNNPSHSALHNTVSSALGQVEAVIGTDASVLGTIIGDLRSAASGGGGHIQTANKGGTGQTSYTKGDLLVASSSSVLTKLAVGTDNQVLMANSSVAAGVSWGAGAVPTVRVYSSASTLSWVKPANISYAIVRVQAGGGAGAAGADLGANGRGGGGGGAGGYSEKVYTSSVLHATETVVIGAAGGNSSFSISANSVLAVAGSAGSAAVGGAGGGASGGDINLEGGDGTGAATGGATGTSAGGAGGTAHLGGGGAGSSDTGTAGSAGNVYGGGGGGGSGSDSAASSGGAGAAGIVTILEY